MSAKKLPEYTFQQRGWFERENSFYLTTIDSKESDLSFVCYNAKKKVFERVHEITLSDPITEDGDVLTSGKKIIPRQPPKNKDGVFVDIVGIPDTNAVLNAPDETARCIMELILTHIGKYCDMSVL